MFKASLVWLLVYAGNTNGAAPLGTFSTKEACLEAASQAVNVVPVYSPAAHSLFCVPVEKPIGK
jgi:hypothetical protein